MKPTAILLTILIAGLGLSACGSKSGGGGAVRANTVEKSPAGDIPDNQAYVAYRLPGAGFAIKVPEGWAQTRSGKVATFTDKLNSVRLESTSAAVAAALPVPKGASTSTVSRTAGKAKRVTYLARSAADPVTGRRTTDAVERYVFTRGSRAAVVTLTGAKGADNVDPWRIVTDSFRWTR